MESKHQYFITGIGTDVGKTVVSAVLVKALHADYWKPVQSGDLHNSDTMKIQKWCDINEANRIHPERHQLTQPLSPHASAAIDKVQIQLTDFSLPETDRSLIIEGAGGLAVPLNNRHTLLDLIKHLGTRVILVARNYLGSINHTLLSIEALRLNNIEIKGLVVFGERTKTSEEVIVEMTKLPILFAVESSYDINADFIQREAERLKEPILAL